MTTIMTIILFVKIFNKTQTLKKNKTVAEYDQINWNTCIVKK